MVKVPEIPARRAPGMVASAGRVMPPIQRRPTLETMKPAPDPISDRPPGDPSEDAAIEIDELKAGFRERMSNEAKRFKSTTASDYYSVIVFETGEQADAFWKALGMIEEGSKQFVDGRSVADRLQIELPRADLKFNPGAKPDPKLSALVRRPG